MKFEIDQMLKTGGGAIVNTSSIFGLNGYPGWSLYSATKHAVTGMTKSAALDYAKQNVRVNAVGPGPIETPLLAKGTGGDPHSYASFVPMGRIGQPDEIADAVVWLLSGEARFVMGHTLPVDGGVSSSALVDHVLIELGKHILQDRPKCRQDPIRRRFKSNTRRLFHLPSNTCTGCPPTSSSTRLPWSRSPRVMRLASRDDSAQFDGHHMGDGRNRKRPVCR